MKCKDCENDWCGYTTLEEGLCCECLGLAEDEMCIDCILHEGETIIENLEDN